MFPLLLSKGMKRADVSVLTSHTALGETLNYISAKGTLSQPVGG